MIDRLGVPHFDHQPTSPAEKSPQVGLPGQDALAQPLREGLDHRNFGTHATDPVDAGVSGRFIRQRERSMRPLPSPVDDRLQNVEGANLRWRQNQEHACDVAKATDGVQVYVRATSHHGGDGSVRMATLTADAATDLRAVLGFQQDRQRIETVAVLLDSGTWLAVEPDGRLSIPGDFNPRDLSDADYRFLCLARDKGVLDDARVLQELALQEGQVHLSRRELQLHLPAETPPWLRAIAGVSGALASFVVGQYETRFHTRDWQEKGLPSYPAMTSPFNEGGSLSRENNNPIALLQGGGSGGHFLNTAELVTLYRFLGSGLQEGVEAVNHLIGGPDKPVGASDSALRQIKQVLAENLQRLQAHPEVWRVLAERIPVETVQIPAGVDPYDLRGRLGQLWGDAPETRQRIDRYAQQMETLRGRLATATTSEQAHQICDEMDAATLALVQEADGLPGHTGAQVKAVAGEFMAFYLANRTLTTMGEIIEVTHNIGAALKNLPFPVFSVLPQPGPDGRPVSHYSINDIGDRIANTAGLTARILQQSFDRAGVIRFSTTSPLAQNSGGSFTPTGIYLPDYANVRPAFEGGITASTDAGGVSLSSVVRTLTGSGGLVKQYMPIHFGMSMAGGNDEYGFTYDPNAPDLVVPTMGPSTSYMTVGGTVNPGHFFPTCTSPFVQNGTLFARYTTTNPSSPSAMTEHLQPGSPYNVAPDDVAARFHYLQAGYHLPVSNFVPRLGPGGIGGFLDDYFDRLRVGVTAGYSWGTLDPKQPAAANLGKVRVAPYVSAQVMGLDGTEGFWGTLKEVGLGVLRGAMTVGVQAGVHAATRGR